MNTSTATQQVTEDLRQWLRAQLAAGRQVGEVIDAMRASGWSDAAATAALQQLEPGAQEPAQVPAGGPVPEPAVDGGATHLSADGHAMQVLLTLRQPRVVLLGGFLAHAECDQLIEEARPRLTRSETIDNHTGGSEVNAARTSLGMFFSRGESPLIRCIESRIAAVLNWPVLWGEGLQVLNYKPGAEYKPHHDFFDPKHSGTESILKRGGQRVGTLIMYLNTPERGGGTVFPDVLLDVAAVKGNAVFFSYDRPHAVTRTLHGGSPVVEGEKWVATKWLREREFN